MDEYIKQETVLKEILSVYEREFPTASGAFDEFVTKIVPNILACIPSADVTPARIGFWTPIHASTLVGWNPAFAGYDPILGYQCSLCGNEAIFSCNDMFVLSDYCPKCGAKMEA